MTVEKGWRWSKEVNRVLFDPETVTVRQMEQWLKDAGTYIGTLDEPAARTR